MVAHKSIPRPSGLLITDLLDQALFKLPSGQRDFVTLSKKVDYRPQHLWACYYGKRKMPALRLVSLCRFLGLKDHDFVQILAEQDANWAAWVKANPKPKSKNK